MSKIKEIIIEIQEKYGDEIEITEQIFKEYLVEKGIFKEDSKDEEE